MKQRQTLRSRIIFFFCTYLGILLFIYSAAISGLISLSQDVAFEKQLIETSDQVIMSLQQTGKVPSILPFQIKVYTELPDIPSELRTHVSGHDPGFFEIDTESLDYHVGICAEPSTGKRVYLFYDVGAYELSEGFEFTFNLALLGVGFCVLLVGWILSRSISSQIMTPITTLAKTVDSFSIEDQFKPIPSYPVDDEVGLLVNTINDLIRRTDQFVQREREFTQFASHELRTPLTVIKGAVEIIQAGIGYDNKKLNPPLTRIDLSIRELDDLIKTFLMLARQDHIHNREETPCEIKAEVEKTVTAYRYLLEGKPVEVLLDTKRAGTVSASASVVNIAIGNLVRNAFQYTMSGKVEIICNEKHIQVSDTGLGLEDSKPSTGSGLGLLIVKRLCERMDWQYKINTLPGGGTRADLFFLS